MDGQPKTGLRKKSWFSGLFYIHNLDTTLLAIFAVMVVVGLISLFSSSHILASYSQDCNYDSYFYIKNQMKYTVIGIVFMIIASCVDYHKLHVFAIPVLLLSIVLLIWALRCKGVDNVHRWINLGGFTFQSSELAKFSIILLFAHVMSTNYGVLRRPFWTNFLTRNKESGLWNESGRLSDKGKNQLKEELVINLVLLLIPLGITCLLIMKEPHMSCTILVACIGIILMFAGGGKICYLAACGLAGLVLVIGKLGGGYEGDRMDVWLHPIQVFTSGVDPTTGVSGRDTAWQTVQSLFSLGSGGLWGLGFGNSRQKHLFLPECHNDFIFAVICEELGFIGAMLVIVLFAVFVFRGLKIARNAKDKFGYLLALGITSQIALQVILNIAVVANAMPNTGISLPFFSFGGSALVILYGEIGVLLSVARQADLKKKKKQPEIEE